MMNIFYTILVLAAVALDYSAFAGGKPGEALQESFTHSYPQPISAVASSASVDSGKDHALIEGLSLTLHGVALFKSESWISYMVTHSTWSNWSHSALILRDLTKDPADQTGWYSFEVQEDIYKLQNNPSHVQINPWNIVVSKYPGNITARPIQFNEESTPDPEAVLTFVKKFLGRPFKKNYFCLLQSILGSNRKWDEEESLKSVFCSELTAHMLMSFGFLPDYSVVSNYRPKDFSAERDLKLIGATWREEISVKKWK